MLSAVYMYKYIQSLRQKPIFSYIQKEKFPNMKLPVTRNRTIRWKNL